MKPAPMHSTSISRLRAGALGATLAALAAGASICSAAEPSADPGARHHGSAAAADTLRSPYSTLPGTGATGLLPQEVQGLTKGEGMALALAAEANGYPGPRHLLDAATAGQLELRPGQREAIQRIYDRMLAEAVAKGQDILQAEANLALRFRHAHIDEAALRDLVDRIGRLRADLRFIHLRTHLETKALLTPEQLARYNTLRGYDAGAGSGQHRAH